MIRRFLIAATLLVSQIDVYAQDPKTHLITRWATEQRAVDSAHLIAVFNEMYVMFDDIKGLADAAKKAVSVPGVLRVQFAYESPTGLVVVSSTKPGAKVSPSLSSFQLNDLVRDLSLAPEKPVAIWIDGVAYGVCRIPDPIKGAWVVVTVGSEKVTNAESTAMLPNHSMHQTLALRATAGDFER